MAVCAGAVAPGTQQMDAIFLLLVSGFCGTSHPVSVTKPIFKYNDIHGFSRFAQRVTVPV